jgi:hypothetical protein
MFAALALTTTSVVTTATQIAPAGAALPAPPVIKVVMGTTAAGMTVDTINPRPAGRVTFEVTGTDPENEHDFQIAQIEPGISPEIVIAEVTNGLEREDAPPDLNALKAFNRHVRLIGGVNVLPGGKGGAMTLTLARGTYYLLDTSAPAAEAIPAAKVLVVTGAIQSTAVPGVSSIIEMRTPDRFRVTAHLPADGHVLVRNRADEPHFVFIEPVQPGTTDAQIQALFDRAAAGDESAFDQFPGRDGPAAGTGVVDPGYQVVWTYHLEPGLYLMSCFWPDEDTGMPHAFMGMHQVVSIG